MSLKVFISGVIVGALFMLWLIGLSGGLGTVQP